MEDQKYVSVVKLEMVREGSIYGSKCDSATAAVKMIRTVFNKADREMMIVASFSTAMEPVAVEVVAVGGIDSCPVDVRNIFKHALLSNATGIICFHNHPGNNPAPSKYDIEVTERLKQAGEILGVTLHDHIIVTDDSYYSFKDKGNL